MQEKNLLIGTALIVTMLFSLGIFVYLSEPTIETIPVVNGSTNTGKTYKLYIGQIVSIRGGYNIMFDGSNVSVSSVSGGGYNSQYRSTLNAVGYRGQHFFVGEYEYRVEGLNFNNEGGDYQTFLIIQEVVE